MELASLAKGVDLLPRPSSHKFTTCSSTPLSGICNKRLGWSATKNYDQEIFLGPQSPTEEQRQPNLKKYVRVRNETLSAAIRKGSLLQSGEQGGVCLA